MRILALTSDLMFSSNIETTLRRAGYDVSSIEDLTNLERELDQGDADLVILDLHAGFPAQDVIRLCSESPVHGDRGRQPVPVLAFGRHTEPALLRSAREAGCVEAVPRSTFVEDMVGLVERVAGQG